MFYKRKPDVITPENLHQDVFVSSMMDSPVSALYHALHKIYCPLLLKDSKWSAEFDETRAVDAVHVTVGSEEAEDETVGARGF